jgi:hypothetical protein
MSSGEDLMELKEEYFTRDYRVEPGASHIGMPKYASSFTKGMRIKVFPNSSSSISVTSASQSSSMIFNLPRAGYLCSWSGSEAFLEVTATPNVNCQMEPYASVAKFTQTYNGTDTTGKFNHPYRAACNEILDTPLSKLDIEGPMYGLGATANSYEPFVNSIATTQALQTAGATAAQAGNYVTTAGRTFLIPLRILADGLICDPDSLTPLALLNNNQIEIIFLATQSWCSNISGTPAGVTVTLSNPRLFITRTTVSSDLNSLYMSLMADARLALHTTSKVSQGLTQQVNPSTQNVNCQFTGLPRVMKQIELTLESPAARTNIGTSYKGLTTPDAGITSYRFFLDGVPVSDRDIDVQNYEAYAIYTNMRYNRLKGQKDIQSLANAAIGPYIHSGLGSSIPGAYPSSDSDAAGNYIVFNRAFRACADLGSVNSSFYSGSSARIVDFTFSTDSDVSYYNTGASTQTAISQYTLILLCHSPARVVLGLGSAVYEV